MGYVLDKHGDTIFVDNGKIICPGCHTREGHEHRCFVRIELKDRLVNVFVVTNGLSDGEDLPMPFFQGMASQLNNDLLLVRKCDCDCQHRPTEKSLAAWTEAGYPNDFEFEYEQL